MPMNSRAIDGFKAREHLWVDRRRGTHMTLQQIAHKYGVSRGKVITILPPPDVVSPYGNHTRLWLRETVSQKLGEPAQNHS